MPKNEKQKKIKKAPMFYPKHISEEKLVRKYLKYIQVPVDKSFILSCYAKQDNLLVIRTDLYADEVRRLKELKAAIKKNKKFTINILPIVVIAAIIAAIVFFFAVLANPLLQKAFEKGMEAIFEARVNAHNFKISLVRFEIGMNGLTIADRDEPMKNLIQFSKMRIKLKPEAVLRGKVYIEEIRADEIRFGTERTISGALPDKAPKEKRTMEEMGIPPLVDLQNFDPMALLNQEYAKLQTPKLYDAAIEAYDASKAKWQNEQAAVKARLAELQNRAEPFLRINVNDYRNLDANTINQIRTLIDDINAMTASVQAAQNDVSRMVTEIQDDINTARFLEQNARNSLTSDFNYLRSFLDPGSGAITGVVESIVWNLLSATAHGYIAYGERALELLDKVKAMQEKLPPSAPKPPKAEKFKGRDVVFPSVQYPRFFMGVLATDVLTPNGWNWDFDLRGVSSDPDISIIPTSLALDLNETGDGLHRSGSFKGQADLRTNARQRFNAGLSGAGFPLDISANLSQVGIGGFSGGSSFAVYLEGNTDSSFTGSADISLHQAKLSNPSNTFAQAADEAIRQVSSVDLGINYEHIIYGSDRFTVNTNFGDILKDAMGRIIAQYIRRAEDELERALRARIEQYIDGKFISKEELDLVFSALRGDKSAVDTLKSTLDNKKAELENRIRSTADQALDEVKDQSQQAIQDILQGRPPTAPTLPVIQNPFGR